MSSDRTSSSGSGESNKGGVRYNVDKTPVGFCPQSAFVLTGTVYENVVMGRTFNDKGVEE